MIKQQQPFDPGLTQKFTGNIRRSINRDGSFNVQRSGVGLRNINLYLTLINAAWWKFLSGVLVAYIVVNCLFAFAYLILGIDNLEGARPNSPAGPFFEAFFFSVHTLTTVGYGNIVPKTIGVSMLASLEALVGLMGFALATGLLYGRVSRPSARMVFSDNMLLAPYRDITSLQFRVANQRTNILMEIEATMMLMIVEGTGTEMKRKYFELNLERKNVFFLPLSWTVVHPIDETSPLWGKSAEDYQRDQAEILILVRAFDDTFSQTVHARRSYTTGEIVWNASFEPAFYVDPRGDLVLQLERLHEIRRLG